MSETPTCQACGAPDDGELVYCKFCRAAFSAESARTAIPCPRCNTACRWGRQRCGACQAWLVVSCVFCGALSPHNVPSCMSCREPFAGASQRKAARDAERQQHQQVQMMGAVGSVAAPLLGAAVGAALGSSFGRGGDYEIERDEYDTSGVVEDTGDVDDGGSSDW